MVIKECAICGKEFTQNKTFQIYCTRECYKKSRQAEIVKPRMKKAAEKKKPKMSILDINTAARAAGMTYGQYVAQMTLQEMERRK